MSTQIQRRRGTTAQHASFTGAIGETTIDTDKEVVVVHDGTQVGGYPLMRENASNSALALGSAATPSLKFTGDTNTGLYSPGADQLAISTGGSGRLFVDASGRVGVGNNSPTANLQVTASGSASNLFINSDISTSALASRIALGNSINTGRATFGLLGGGGETAYLGSEGNFPLYFQTNGSERLRITSAGNVGIGTSSPAQKLDVAGSIVAVGNISAGGAGANWVSSSSNGVTTTYLITDANGSNLKVDGVWPIRFTTNNSEVGRFTADGKLLVGTSTARSGIDGGVAPAFQVEGSTLSTASVTVTRNSNDNSPPAIYLNKSRSSSYSVVSSGDNLGVIAFTGADGTITASAATIKAEVDGTPGSNDMPGRLVFSTTADGAASPTERMRIWSTGRISINSTAALAQGQLEVQHNGAVTQGINVADSSSEPVSTAISFIKASGTRGSITVSSTATAYNTSSDYRLKENVTAVTDGITRLQQLKPSRFNFIADPNTVVDGFLAHEAQAVVPECVTGEKDAVDDNGNPVYQGIDQSKLVPLLTAALQEAIGRIETLETEVSALKGA